MELVGWILLKWLFCVQKRRIEDGYTGKHDLANKYVMDGIIKKQA
jgi:hypothetical protein